MIILILMILISVMVICVIYSFVTTFKITKEIKYEEFEPGFYMDIEKNKKEE